MKLERVRLKLEPRDAWVGLFWDVQRFCGRETLHVYICAIPFVPLHIEVSL